MGEDRIPRKLLNTIIHGKRSVGRPRRRWEDVVDEDVKEIGLLKVRSWRRMATDRREWGEKLKDARDQQGP